VHQLAAPSGEISAAIRQQFEQYLPRPAHIADDTPRGQEPAAIFGSTKKGRNVGRRVKSRKREPIDGAISTYEGGRFAIANERVLFEREHASRELAIYPAM
jgi:hypothetical protein